MLPLLRARYDAAVTTNDNRRHWAGADRLSANVTNSPEVRRILRNWSRYEIANNSYARGIVLTMANDVIGTGPRLQMLTGDAEANRRIERDFALWAREVSLAEKLRTLRMARAEDGEGFIILTSNPAIPTPMKLDLRLVEADQVGTPDLSIVKRNAVDGIVFDEMGNPVEYHVLKNHPPHPNHRHAYDTTSDKVDVGQDGTEQAWDTSPGPTSWTSGIDYLPGVSGKSLERIHAVVMGKLRAPICHAPHAVDQALVQRRVEREYGDGNFAEHRHQCLFREGIIRRSYGDCRTR